MKKRNCVVCGLTFAPTYGRQVTCDEHLNMRKIPCSECGEDFLIKAGSKRKTCYDCKSKPRACEECGTVFSPDPEAKVNARWCSVKCRQRAKYVRDYERKGYDQKGEKNNAYKNGIFDYSNKGFEHYGRKCNRCSSEDNLCVHHRDRNRQNNDLNNLEVLCRSCHSREHKLHENFSTKTKV